MDRFDAFLIGSGVLLGLGGLSVLLTTPAWTVSPLLAGMTLLATGLVSLVIAFRRRQVRQRDGVITDERDEVIAGYAARGTLAVMFPVLGALVAVIGMTTLDPPAQAVLGPLFSLFALVWVGLTYYYKRQY